MQKFLSVIFLLVGDDRDDVCVCLGKELQGQLSEGLQFPKLSVVEDRLKIFGSFWFLSKYKFMWL